MERKYKDFSELPLTLTATDVAEILGIARVKAYELVQSKGFPRIILGRRILIPRDKFIEWYNAKVEE